MKITRAFALSAVTAAVVLAAGGGSANAATAAAAVDTPDAQTISNFEDAVNAIDAALATINSSRADLGAAQNRFASTISNLRNINEDAAAAPGQI